jgi:hypothetical protein
MVTITLIAPMYKGAKASANVKGDPKDGSVKILGAMRAEITIADDDRIRLENLVKTWGAADRSNDKEYYGAFDELDIEAYRAAARYYGVA